MSPAGTAQGQVPENWGPRPAVVEEGPRKMTQEMEVFILDRLQRIAGKAPILQEPHRQCLGAGLGEAGSEGLVFQSLPRPAGARPRFPIADH